MYLNLISPKVPKLLTGISLKLQKQTSRTTDRKDYYKWVVVLPPEQIDQLKWENGSELESEVKNNSIILRLMTEKPQSDKMAYDTFKKTIQQELEKKPHGLTWTEIRASRPELYQTVPNNLWVRTLEREIGLIREKTGTKTIWRLK